MRCTIKSWTKNVYGLNLFSQGTNKFQYRTYHIKRSLQRCAKSEIIDSPKLDYFGGHLMQREIEYYLQSRFALPKDPTAFLIESEKLSTEERFYQIFFSVIPWILLLAMLFFPSFLIVYLLPYFDKRSKYENQITAQLMQDMQLSDFRHIRSTDLYDILDSTFHTLICFYHSSKFSSVILLAKMMDLSKILKKFGIQVNVVAIDLAENAVPESVLSNKSVLKSPFLLFIIPYIYDGEAAALDITDNDCLELFLASDILSKIESYIPINRSIINDAKQLDSDAQQLFQCLFEMKFIDSQKFQDSEDHENSAIDLYFTNLTGEIKINKTLKDMYSSCIKQRRLYRTL